MSSADITSLLQAWHSGDQEAGNSLIASIYPVLRDIARSQLRRTPGSATLQATELAHEAYVRLQKQQPKIWQNRNHFFSMAATVIRHLLVDHLRRRASGKHGGDVLILAIEPGLAAEIAQPDDDVDWLALDQALVRLEKLDPISARVVELRLFTGLNVEEVAHELAISTATVGRHWRFARAFLTDHLNG